MSHPCTACDAQLEPNALVCPKCGIHQLGGETTVSESGDTPAPAANGANTHGRFEPGTILSDRYRVVSLLGRGGMGEVYRADDLKLGEPVALKFLTTLGNDTHRLELFLNEVRLSRQVSHPNICRVHDIGEVDGLHFLSMEYIDGEDLKGLLMRIGRLPHDKGVQIAKQLCAALAAAHEKGVLHRDLKPANIMIDGRGQARLTDFGVASVVGDSSDGRSTGTPAYMAPEQLAKSEATAQSDLYALGLILFEMFTGQRPFHGSTRDELRAQRERGLAQFPPDAAQSIDPTVSRVIQQCLASTPSQRPRSIAELVAAFDAVGAQPRPGRAPSTSDPTGTETYDISLSWLKPAKVRVRPLDWPKIGGRMGGIAAAGLVIGLIHGKYGGQSFPIQESSKWFVAWMMVGSACLIPSHRGYLFKTASKLFQLQLVLLWGLFLLGSMLAIGFDRIIDDLTALVVMFWIISALGGQLLLAIQHLWRRPKLPPTGAFCPDCSYPLKGLSSNECPECGRPFTLEELEITESALRV